MLLKGDYYSLLWVLQWGSDVSDGWADVGQGWADGWSRLGQRKVKTGPTG